VLTLESDAVTVLQVVKDTTHFFAKDAAKLSAAAKQTRPVPGTRYILSKWHQCWL